MWKLDPENERLVIAEEGPEDGGELPLPTTSSMSQAAMWVHGEPNILNNCKTAHVELEEAPADWDQTNPDQEFDAEAYNKAFEAKDPYEPLLKPIHTDAPVGLSETIRQPAWTVRLCGDPAEYKHEELEGPQAVPTKSYGVVVVRSLVWPGAMSFYYQGRTLALYVGNTHKWEFGKHFFPVETPTILADPEDYEDGPEPNPADAPEEDVAEGEGEAAEGEGEGKEGDEEGSEY